MLAAQQARYHGSRFIRQLKSVLEKCFARKSIASVSCRDHAKSRSMLRGSSAQKHAIMRTASSPRYGITIAAAGDGARGRRHPPRSSMPFMPVSTSRWRRQQQAARSSRVPCTATAEDAEKAQGISNVRHHRYMLANGTAKTYSQCCPCCAVHGAVWGTPFPIITISNQSGKTVDQYTTAVSAKSRRWRRS